MKVFIILSVLLVAAYADLNSKVSSSDSKIPAKLQTYWDECLLENGLSPEQIKELWKKGEWKQIGCVVACMAEKLQMVDEEGKIIPEKVNAFINRILTAIGRDFTEEMKNVTYKCAKEAEQGKLDRCSKHIQFAKCMYQNFHV